MATTNRNRKAKAIPARTLEEIVLQQFADAGEVTGLGALADWLDENRPDAGEYSARLRELMGDSFRADAVRFFMGNGLVDPSARFAAACRLRDAEEWLDEREPLDAEDPCEGDVRVLWEIDPEYNPADYDSPDVPAEGWRCLIDVFIGGIWDCHSSLGAITFADGNNPWSDDYRRLVEAELASELM